MQTNNSALTYTYRPAFIDMPLGEAGYGPAYGDKFKSKGVGMVIGVVAGVMTAGAGYAAMMAAEAGSLGALAGGAMMAGGVMSTVGAVTGNAKLSKTGGVLSLAGGIGTVGNNLATGGSLTAAGESAASMENFTSGLSKVADNFTGTFKELMGGAPTAAPTATPGGISQSSLNAFGTTQTLEGAAGVPSATAVSSNPMILPGSEAAVTPTINLADTSAVVGRSANAGSAAVGAGTAAAGAGNQTPKASSGILGSALDLAKSPGGGMMLGNIAQGIGGASLNEAQQRLADANVSMLDFKMELENQRRANMNDVIVALDPNDPSFAEKKATAEAAGRKTTILQKFGTAPVAKTPVDYAQQFAGQQTTSTKA